MCVALHHILNKMPVPKHDTQIPSHTDPELPVQMFLHSLLYPAKSDYMPLRCFHSFPPRKALSIFTNLDILIWSSKGSSEITFSVELFLMTSKAASLLPPPCSQGTLGRSPLYCSTYFIIVNCVHICLPHRMMCLPFKGKDNVLPIPHPSSIQQHVRCIGRRKEREREGTEGKRGREEGIEKRKEGKKREKILWAVELL